MRRIMFVSRALTGEAARSANAIQTLEDVELLSICVNDVVDARSLIEAAKAHGKVDQIVTAQETLLAAVAEANERLHLPGMTLETVTRTLDKSKLKSTLRQAGIKVPRDQPVTTLGEARRFADEIGFPFVLKPMNGGGGLTTFRMRDDEQLAQIMTLVNGPMLAEEFIAGEELCFDTVTIANEPQCYTVCRYNPPIINALENPAQQWRCVMPRDNGSYADFIGEGLAAVRALRVGNAITHMEGFINASGPAGFVDATLRPAGARIGPMFGFAFNVDPYRLWARVAIDGCFDGPLERRYAVGTIFLRSAGSGSVKTVAGIETIKDQLNDVIVESRFPKIGVPKSATYTGDGFITVRHSDTSIVEKALDFIDQTVRINYTSSLPGETVWSDRLLNFGELNKPAWDFEVVK